MQIKVSQLSHFIKLYFTNLKDGYFSHALILAAVFSCSHITGTWSVMCLISMKTGLGGSWVLSDDSWFRPELSPWPQLKRQSWPRKQCSSGIHKAQFVTSLHPLCGRKNYSLSVTLMSGHKGLMCQYHKSVYSLTNVWRVFLYYNWKINHISQVANCSDLYAVTAVYHPLRWIIRTLR